jgi:hypothetical protein
MGDASQTHWSKETAERVAKYMTTYETGSFIAEPMLCAPSAPNKESVPARWRDALDDIDRIATDGLGNPSNALLSKIFNRARQALYPLDSETMPCECCIACLRCTGNDTSDFFCRAQGRDCKCQCCNMEILKVEPCSIITPTQRAENWLVASGIYDRRDFESSSPIFDSAREERDLLAETFVFYGDEVRLEVAQKLKRKAADLWEKGRNFSSKEVMDVANQLEMEAYGMDQSKH